MKRAHRLSFNPGWHSPYIKLALLVVGAVLAMMFLHPHKAYADYDGARLIDNQVFLDANSMNAAQIQQFFVDRGAGLASKTFTLTCGAPSETATMQAYAAINAPCGQTVAASTIIYYVAQVYGVSPRVILATMQKEQSLSTAANPTDWQINQAMGYGCPDNGGCGASTFFYQVDNGTWVLRYHYERANYNNTWWNNGTNVCGGASMYRSAGLYAGATVTFKDEVGTSYRTYTLANAATAAFYCYTPHAYNNHKNGAPNSPNPVGTLCYNDGIHPEFGSVGYCYTGSFNFVYWFERWFGSTIHLDVQSIRNSLPVTIVTQPYGTPAVGQHIDYVVSFKNNFSFDITLDAIGAVGRAGNMLTGTNRDFGWQGSFTIAAGATKQLTLSTVVQDTGSLYIWPSVLYQGMFVQYNPWGITLTGHSPNLTLSQPLLNNPTSPYAGQNVLFTATLKNNEPFAVNYDAIGIPVKYYDTYNYDAVWVGPGTIAAGAELALSGTRLIDKPGPFSFWVSDYFGGKYSLIGAVKKFTALPVSPNFSVSALSFAPTVPVVGQSLGASFTITNNLPVGIDVDAVGIVGRYGTFSGPNRDIGWQGPIHFNAGESKQFTSFARPITDLGTHYYWIAVLFNGAYVQFNNWGSTLVSVAPSFSVSALNFSTTTPAVGQNLDASFTVTNNLPSPVDVGGVGVVGRFGTLTGPNRDIGWQGPVHFNAGESKSFSGYSRTITDTGTHYYWIGIFYQGSYMQYNNWGSTIVSH